MQSQGLRGTRRAAGSPCDLDGLLEPSRTDLSDAQKIYAHKAAPSKDLAQTMAATVGAIL